MTTTARTIVLVSLSRRGPGEALIAGVSALRERGHRVVLLSRRSPAPDLAAAIDETHLVPGGRLTRLPTQMPARLTNRAPRPVGRALRLLRADADRLPAAVRLHRDPELAATLSEADVVVALDAEAIPAAWWAARRRPDLLALTGLPAALTRLTC